MVMLSPTEELGLSGMSLDSRVREALSALPAARIASLIDWLREQSLARHLIYQHDGHSDPVRILPRPIVVLPHQLTYLHHVSLSLLDALKRIPEMYLQDPEVRATVPLTPPEEEWLRQCWGPSQREENPIFGRLDAMAEFTSPRWQDSLCFIEPNLCGVGGIHYAPMAEQLVADRVLSALCEQDPQIQMEVGDDLRELFIQQILDHLAAIGRPGRNLCFVEPKYATDGPDEQESLTCYFRERHGMTVMHADPAELRLSGGEVYCGDQVVDMAYRDYEIRDLLALGQQRGVDLAPVRALFQQNRMISSIGGDFDHKSCWELFTDPRFTQRHFSAVQRHLFRRHVLWTRLLADRRTTLPDGEMGDLLPYARGDRDGLVLKPNRSYGGDRIVIGHSISQGEWEAALQAAVAGEAADKISGDDAWVVQRVAHIPVNEFPVLSADGTVHSEPFYTVMGFAPTEMGLGILCRASQKQVVNVAQRGGICAVLVARTLGPLGGPLGPARAG